MLYLTLILKLIILFNFNCLLYYKNVRWYLINIELIENSFYICNPIINMVCQLKINLCLDYTRQSLCKSKYTSKIVQIGIWEMKNCIKYYIIVVTNLRITLNIFCSFFFDNWFWHNEATNKIKLGQTEFKHVKYWK